MIQIEQVANGFVVTSGIMHRGECRSNDDTYVFQTMENLQKWIDQHFSPVQKTARQD